jgi:N-acetylmuramoyl-L-alanine amidase
VKQAGFYVLWGASMPAVLVELGFVTGRRDASFLKSESGQTSMANAIFSAVRDFKETLEKDLHLARQ